MIATEHSAPNTPTYLDDIPIDLIHRSDLNPRKHFDEEALAELAESIRQHGVMQPIVVRPAVDDWLLRSTPVSYIIVAGERRWRAAQLAGIDTIPAVIRGDLTDADHLRLALIENLQRRDLDPIEEAEGYARLNRVVGLRQAEIAQAVNRSQPAVANAMRLLDLPEDVQERIRRRELSVAHGIALARYKGFPALVQALADLAVEHRWTSHYLEKGALEQYRYQFESKKLVRSVDYGTRFDIAANCQRCPFGAYRKGEYGPGICLKPEHYQELQDAAVAEQRAALEAKMAETADIAGEATLIKLEDLEYQQYQRLDFSSPPVGCGEDCSCRKMAIDRAGEPVEICIDPQRFATLKTAETKAEKASKREQHKADVARLETHMDAIEMPVEMQGHRELVLICAAALSQISKPTSGKAAAEHTGVADLLADMKFARWEMRSDGLDQLNSLATGDLVKLTVEAIVRDDLASKYEGYGGEAKRADWYLGTTGTAAWDAAKAELERWKAEPWGDEDGDL